MFDPDAKYAPKPPKLGAPSPKLRRNQVPMRAMVIDDCRADHIDAAETLPPAAALPRPTRGA